MRLALPVVLLVLVLAAPAEAGPRLRLSAPANADAGARVVVTVHGGPARVTLARSGTTLALARGVRGRRTVRVPATARPGRWALRACARTCTSRHLVVREAEVRGPSRSGAPKATAPAPAGGSVPADATAAAGGSVPASAPAPPVAAPTPLDVPGPPAAAAPAAAAPAATGDPRTGAALVVDADDPSCADDGAVLCSLPAAVAAAPAGGTVTLRPAATPYPALTATRDDLTLRGEGTPVLTRLVLRGADRWTVTGIATTAGLDVRDVSDLTLQGLDVRSVGVLAVRADRLAVRDSRFHDLDFAADQAWSHGTAAGYGVRVVGGRDLRVERTTFERLTLDAVQLSDVAGATIAGSTVTGLRTSRGSHADALQVQAGSSKVLWTDNVVRDSDRGVIVDAAAGDVTVRDSLFLHLKEWAVLTHAAATRVTGSSMWDTAQWLAGNQSAIVLEPDARDAVLVDNAMRKLVFLPEQVAAEHHNFVAQPKSYVAYSPTDVLGGLTDLTLLDPLLDLTTLRALPGSPLLGAASDGGTIGFG